MIEAFVRRWEANKEAILAAFKEKWPGSYRAIVETVIEHIKPDEDDWRDNPDPRRITEIDYGDYQGCLVYVIGAAGYQPSDYWYVRVYYGSCSGCDALQAIEGYTDEKTEEQYSQLMMLALGIVQGLKKMDDMED